MNESENTENINQIEKTNTNKKKIPLLQKLNYIYLIYSGIVIIFSLLPIESLDYSIWGDILYHLAVKMEIVSLFIIIPFAFIFKVVLLIREFKHYYPIGKIFLFILLDVLMFVVIVVLLGLRLSCAA